MSTEAISYLVEIEERCHDLEIPRKKLNKAMENFIAKYKRERRKVRINNSLISDVTQEEVGAELYRRLTAPDDSKDKETDEVLCKMFRSPWFEEKVKTALNHVMEFSEFGLEYYKILTEVLLSDHPARVEEICSGCIFSRASYYRRREEALKLFASILWEDCISTIGQKPMRLEYLVRRYY